MDLNRLGVTSRFFVSTRLKHFNILTLFCNSIIALYIRDFTQIICLFHSLQTQLHKEKLNDRTRSGFFKGVRHCCACVNSSGVSVTFTHARVCLWVVIYMHRARICIQTTHFTTRISLVSYRLPSCDWKPSPVESSCLLVTFCNALFLSIFSFFVPL